MVAVAGPTADNMRRVKVSTNADHPEGRGLCGNAFRTRQACIANDLRADPRGSAFHQFIHSDGAMSGAAFPLLVSGQAVGVMFFISSEKNTFTPEFAELLQRLTDNVSFAIATFDRADEKARTESQKERLTRMFAALSATNEAIMRAKSRNELFDLVCEAAANGGRFTSTTIALATSGQRPSRGSWPPRARRPRRRGTSGCRWTKPVPRAAGSAERRSGPAALHHQ